MRQDEPASAILAYESPRDRPREPWLNPLWALAVSVVYAIADIHSAGSGDVGILLVLIALGGVLGFFRGWVWFPLISIALFAAHAIAIKSGYKRQPYVEKNIAHATVCLFTVVPVGFGAGLGVIARHLYQRRRAV